MRWSQAFIPTLRDDPADAEAVSHRLLIRAGFIRQLAAGSYSMLPLGQRTRRKVSEIIREEMDRIGGQQFHLPAIHPAELWQRSGRWYSIGDDMFRLTDRKEADLALGMTHEEVFASLAAELFSYRDLPQIWYQIQTKFRDEPRPKSGLLRVREFTMKDSYTLDIDGPGLDAGFDKHREAYFRIFRRLGLEPVDVDASSGAMGGSESVEFVIRSDAGEDWIATCSDCGYRANIERATSRLVHVDDGVAVDDLSRFETPGLRTIATLADAHPDLAAPERQIKTLVYFLDEAPVLLLLRGDHDLQEQKLRDATKAADVRPGSPEEIRQLLGADPGSLGAVSVNDMRIVVDEALRGRHNLVTGANEDDYHFRGVSLERDIDVSAWADLRAVAAGEECPQCGRPLDLWKGIEVGHIFKLGTMYSEAFGVMVQDAEGESHPVIMGSYGIGVERAIAAVVEANHDDRGIVWPVAVAPYEVVITLVRSDAPEVAAAGQRIYDDLIRMGVEALLDDRSERPGVKFADAELVGIPYRVTVGPRGVETGEVEIMERRGMAVSSVLLDDAAQSVADLVAKARTII